MLKRTYGGYTIEQLDKILDESFEAERLTLTEDEVFGVLNDLVIAARKGW